MRRLLYSPVQLLYRVCEGMQAQQQQQQLFALLSWLMDV
jgi:hypothetical protein